MKKSTLQAITFVGVTLLSLPLTRYVVEKYSGFSYFLCFAAILAFAFVLHGLVYKPIEKKLCKDALKEKENGFDDKPTATKEGETG